VLYLGPPDLRRLVNDAAIVREMNPKLRGTVRLSGGRWLRQPQRDVTLLAGALQSAGYEELAGFYRSEAERARTEAARGGALK